MHTACFLWRKRDYGTLWEIFITFHNELSRGGRFLKVSPKKQMSARSFSADIEKQLMSGRFLKISRPLPPPKNVRSDINCEWSLGHRLWKLRLRIGSVLKKVRDHLQLLIRCNRKYFEAFQTIPKTLACTKESCNWMPSSERKIHAARLLRNSKRTSSHTFSKEGLELLSYEVRGRS